jgi:hypothetical protein
MSHREPTATVNRGNATSPVSDLDRRATRRDFLSRIPGAAAVTVVSSAVPFAHEAARADTSDGSGSDRVRDSYENREEAAREESKLPVPRQITNGDEQRYSNFIGNFSKGLPHNAIGEVDPSAYRSLLNAVRRGTAAAFEQVPLGGNPPTPLVNPLAGLAFDLEGTDSHQTIIPAFPSVASRALADQAVELYWQALCRDVNFTDYPTDLTAGRG